MLTATTITKLREMRLSVMANALKQLMGESSAVLYPCNQIQAYLTKFA